MIFFLAIILFGAALIALGSPDIRTQRAALLVFGAALLVAVLAPEPGNAANSTISTSASPRPGGSD